jgi:predicted Fe-S protein YdhL (DUF1289 family)
MFCGARQPVDSMTLAIRPPTVESPCSKVCAVDPVLELCIGCGRSLAEIAGWLAMTSDERARIMAELSHRLGSMRRPQSPS